ESALIAAADVRPHADLTLVLPPRDNRRAVHHPDVSELRERHAPAVTRWDQQIADGLGVRPRLRGEADDYVEAAIPFEHPADGGAPEGEVDDVLHIAHVDAEARHLVPVDLDAELGLVGFLLDGRVHGARDMA